MPKVLYKCSSCSNSVLAEVSQAIRPMGIGWSLSYSCKECGSSMEFDDYGQPPSEILDLIIREEGLWFLTFDIKDRIKVIKVLRSIYSLSISDAKKKIKDLSGSKTTMEWIQEELESDGIPSSISAG